MNKIKTLYPTEVGEIEEKPLRKEYNRFSYRLEEHIKQNIATRKQETLRQSRELMSKLNIIK